MALHANQHSELAHANKQRRFTPRKKSAIYIAMLSAQKGGSSAV